MWVLNAEADDILFSTSKEKLKNHGMAMKSSRWRRIQHDSKPSWFRTVPPHYSGECLLMGLKKDYPGIPHLASSSLISEKEDC